jgi:hypothetical protein
MYFYMQMRNWFLIFMIVTMSYMIYQKSQQMQKSRPYQVSLASFSIFR